MKITIHGTGLALTPAITAAGEEKFGRLRRMLMRFDHSDLLLEVMCSRTTHHHQKGKIFRCECDLMIGKKQIFAAVESEDLYEAMDHCVGAIKKQVQKLKEQQA